MVVSPMETPLLLDSRRQSSATTSRVNEEGATLPGSSLPVAARGLPSQWRTRSYALVVTIGCIAAVLFVTAAFVSYGLYFQAGDGLARKIDYLAASRSSFHFQPEKNFLGDPCAPMFYKGYYHLFYQYAPTGPIWDTPYWGHTVSTDLIHWKYLDVILGPDQWYDEYGAWTGSVTFLQDGTPAILYTGARNKWGGESDQSLDIALPVDPSDPLLRKWRKADSNPVCYNPESVSSNYFRDPTAAWLEDDGMWRLSVGTGDHGNKDGRVLLFTSSDFLEWKLEETHLHAANGTGIWECVDLYPVPTEGKSGLNHSVLRSEHYVAGKYVLKISVLDRWQDYYAVGTYSTVTHTFTPDDPAMDIGVGLLYDYGNFYGSRSFLDSSTGRRILWGYVNDTDGEANRIAKGWSSLMAIPRTIWGDDAAPENVMQWPVEEVEALRGASASLQNVELRPEGVVEVEGGEGSQLDILVVFEKPNVSSADEAIPDSVDYDCRQRTSADRGIFGPFGLLVHADEDLIEHTAVFFYISLSKDGQWTTHVCSDQSRSTLAAEVDKPGFGSQLKVLATENELYLRILTDHSVLESFVQGGRMVITSRIYPTIALGSNSHTFLFNNGTTPILMKRLDVYQMNAVAMRKI